jgi:ABC-type nitrate/sulfonate/bicarbonate transport system substrate-binding protein
MLLIGYRAIKIGLIYLIMLFSCLLKNRTIPQTTTLLFLVMAMFCFKLSANQTNSTTFTLQLKWFSQYQFAGYYAALEQGYYADEGLNIIINERNIKSNPVDDVLTGRADFGVSDSSLIQRRLNGDPVVALAVIMQSSPLILISLAEQNITHPTDLIGKKVMYQAGFDDAVIIAMLNEVGVNKADFTFVPHNFDDEALINGRVDVMSAYISNQPFLYQTKNRTINILNPANYGIDFYGDNLFTSEALIKKHPDKVLAFRRASLKGWQYALTNSEQIIHSLQTTFNSKKSKAALTYEAAQTKNIIKEKLIELGNINPSRFKRIAEIYIARGLAPSNGSVEGLDYQFYFNQNSSQSFFIGSLILLAVTLFVIFVMALINKRLQNMVEIRTQEFNTAKQEAQLHNTRLKKLVGFVAHDLRNPIGAIMSLSTLAQKPHNSEKLPILLQQIYDSAEKSLELVTAALESSALGTGKFELNKSNFNFYHLVKQSAQSYSMLMQDKAVTLEIAMEQSLSVFADQNRMLQVLDNIILNAVKYALDNSTIVIAAELKDNKIEFECSNQINTQNQSEDDELYKSYGFGLEIVREILNLHHANLTHQVITDRFVVAFQLESTKH